MPPASPPSRPAVPSAAVGCPTPSAQCLADRPACASPALPELSATRSARPHRRGYAPEAWPWERGPRRATSRTPPALEPQQSEWAPTRSRCQRSPPPWSAAWCSRALAQVPRYRTNRQRGCRQVCRAARRRA
eukprot:Mycagemm_TRINITY_DN9499_c0_g1::TRINITY_DN9499_c0_g1_i1::g.3080::m.3080 type:complete len:132 gc:universal TRINITY_DN9499_c0_g1_i1:764-369(-)